MMYLCESNQQSRKIMKKFSILIIFFSALVLTGISQSLQLSNSKGIIPNNSEIIQVGSPDSVELVTYISVKNISANPVNVLCRKTEYKMLDSTEITMCWAGGCYPAKVFVSPNDQLIGAGETNKDFLGHYTQIAFKHFKSGESVVRWTFFNKNNPGDSASILFKYTTYPLGVSELLAGVEMSNIYPNPASGHAQFNIALPDGLKGSVVIRDMVGKTVYNQQIEANSSKVVLNTSFLTDGIYFCSVVVDEKMVQTRKLIVRH
jgi:hypothetical protein